MVICIDVCLNLSYVVSNLQAALTTRVDHVVRSVPRVTTVPLPLMVPANPAPVLLSSTTLPSPAWYLQATRLSASVSRDTLDLCVIGKYEPRATLFLPSAAGSFWL